MSRIEKGVPLSAYLPETPDHHIFTPSGYTLDPDFKMPTVKQPPEEPATPAPSDFQVGDKLHISNPVEGWKAFGVIVGIDPAFDGSAPVYMVNGKIVAMDAEYHEQTYQDYLRWLFDESHIVRGYD